MVFLKNQIELSVVVVFKIIKNTLIFYEFVIYVGFLCVKIELLSGG